MLQAFADVPALWIATCVLLGLIVGSFLNVVIHRVPLMMQRGWRQECRVFLEQPEQDEPEITLSRPASRCPGCKAPIRFYDNIPLLSWLLLRGRCRACRTPISARYPLVELLSGVAAGVVAWQLGPTAAGVAAIGLTWLLIAAGGIDFDHQLLPDSIVLPGLWAGLLLSVWGVFAAPTEAIIGAAAGYLILWSIYHLFRIFTGKEGMGYGDFKLLALFGAWLGWQALPLIIIVSSFAGALIGGLLIATGKLGRGKPMPFGPYLAIAGWIALLWGDQITQAYLSTMTP